MLLEAMKSGNNNSPNQNTPNFNKSEEFRFDFVDQNNNFHHQNNNINMVEHFSIKTSQPMESIIVPGTNEPNEGRTYRKQAPKSSTLPMKGQHTIPIQPITVLGSVTSRENNQPTLNSLFLNQNGQNNLHHQKPANNMVQLHRFSTQQR